MNESEKRLKYPRRTLIRKSMTAVGRTLLSLLANVEINGKERLPQKGPVILAGNHAAILEAVMMAVYSPGMVEFIGNGDIPFDPSYAFIVKAYDLIPVNRGNLDRKSLMTALSTLDQDGILGIFPEGGIWDPAQMSPQIGAAWLSYRSQTPIIPIGFGGIRDGLQKAIKFQRPKLVMNVGEMIPPITLSGQEGSMKSSLEKAALHIMDRINALVPEEDMRHVQRKVDEKYSLKVRIFSDALDKSPIKPPDHLTINHSEAYARLIFNPIMIDVLVRNLRLPIHPLMQVTQQSDLSPVIAAWDAILDYLKVNPGFFTYRFGVQEGLAVEKALNELRALSSWVQDSGYFLTLSPVYRFRNANTGAQVIERGGCFPKSMRFPLNSIFGGM